LHFDAELSNLMSIEYVGFGVLAGSFGEVSDLFGIDDSDGEIRVCKSGGGEVLEASAGFHNDEAYAGGSWLTHSARESGSLLTCHERPCGSRQASSEFLERSIPRTERV